MWTFYQKTGNLIDKNGNLISSGWSGNGLGKNNPDMQFVKDVGVLPAGLYDILAPIQNPTTGNYSLPLSPDVSNVMFGRGNFFIHGSYMGEITPDGFAVIDGVKKPVSEGCIVLPLDVRTNIWESGDHLLRVA
jgi:hypothetical protein